MELGGQCLGEHNYLLTWVAGEIVFFFPNQRTIQWHDWISIHCRPLPPRFPGSDILLLGSFSLCFLYGFFHGTVPEVSVSHVEMGRRVICRCSCLLCCSLLCRTSVAWARTASCIFSLVLSYVTSSVGVVSHPALLRPQG